MWQWVQISFDAIFLCFLLVAHVVIRRDLRRSRPHDAIRARRRSRRGLVIMWWCLNLFLCLLPLIFLLDLVNGLTISGPLMSQAPDQAGLRVYFDFFLVFMAFTGALLKYEIGRQYR